MQASSSKPEKKETKKDSSADMLASAAKEEEAEAHRIHGFFIRFQGLHDNPGS